MKRTSTPIALLATAGLLLTACGGDDDTAAEPAAADDTVNAPSDDPSDDPSDEMSDGGTTDVTGSVADVTTDDASATASTDAPSGTYEPGDIRFRTVNLLDQPVDVYVRTTGLLEGFEIRAGLTPGETSEFAAPPEGGALVITTADAGDPTCVIDCDHLIAVLTGYPEDGPVHTVVLYDDEYSGPSAMDLWEQPVERRGNGNEMPPADPAIATAVVTAIAVSDADFGLRMSVDGTPGCVDPIDRENILIGGNQTLPFDMTGVSSFSIHDNNDRECVQPSHGPFTFDAAPGERVHVLLHGSATGELGAVLLPMTGDAPVGSNDDDADDAGAGADDADSGDRDLAIELMATEVSTTFGLDGDSATCVAELVVDAIGPDVLLVDGRLVELDSLGDAAAEETGAALVASTERCDIEPSVFGG